VVALSVPALERWIWYGGGHGEPPLHYDGMRAAPVRSLGSFLRGTATGWEKALLSTAALPAPASPRYPSVGFAVVVSYTACLSAPRPLN